MQMKFIPLDYDYFDFNGESFVRVWGRTDDGKRVCVIDSFSPYLWAILKEGVSEGKIEKISKEIEKIEVKLPARTTRVLKVELHDKNFLGKPVKAIKIFITNYKDAHAVANKIDFPEVEARRNYDLNIITQYIIEKKVLPLQWHSVAGELLNNSREFKGIDSIIDADFVVKAEKIQLVEDLPFNPNIMAFDIETDSFEIGKGEILMISVVGKNFKKVLTWKKFPAENYVEFCKDEAEMIEKFCSCIKKEKPDIIAGYFSDGFDLPYIRARAEKYKIRMDIGLDNSQPTFARGRITSARITGIAHIDLFRFIETAYSQYLQSETLGLNEVASELLGEGKKEFEHKHSGKINHDDWKDYFEYNLQDSILTYKLAEKIWPDMLEFSRIIQEPLFEITRDRMSQLVENYIIHNLHRFNEIAEKRPLHDEITGRRAREKYEGAFVFQPVPALYENLAIFDFTSMYASITVTHNLSRSTFLENKEKEKDVFEVDIGRKVYFSRKQGFFPLMLAEIIEKRKKYKQEYRKNPDAMNFARSNAYKLLANAAYGYQGFFGARYYCVEAAAATAALGRKFLKGIIDKIDNAGYKVIYADSVDGKTKVFIREYGKIHERKIEELFERVDRIEQGKEYNFKENIEVLTLDKIGNSVFKPIKYVMRHKCKKKMYRVNFTNNWFIDVTEDHSLIGYQSTRFNQKRENKEDSLKRIIEVKPEEIGKKVSSLITLKKIPSENKKTIAYPKEIYEFMGYFIGDGSFSRNKTHNRFNKDYYLRLSLGLDKEEVFKKLIKPLIEKEYIKNYWWSKTRTGDITFNGLKLVKIICKDFKESREKVIHDWLFEETEENIASFLRGLFSADGTVMMRRGVPEIKYTSINESYINEVRKLLYRVGVSNSVFKENRVNVYKTKNKIYSSGSYSKNVWIKDKKSFAERIGFILDRKNRLCKIQVNSRRKNVFKNFEFDTQSVKTIKLIETPKYVYDTEIEGNHRFFANYVLVHNTDGIAFLLQKNSKQETAKFLEKLNSQLPGIMELELEDFYKRGIWVTKRTGEFGAKKKYALLNEKKQLKVRGFETVRRNWCNLAREVQNKVLESILNEGNAESSLKFVKDIIAKIRKRKIEKDKLMIRTQLKKELADYISEGPHVAIAKKMISKGMPVDAGMLIEYYIAEGSGKKQLIRERAKLPDEEGDYDINYYIEHQIVPAVENIFAVFGIPEETLLGKKQKKLHEF